MNPILRKHLPRHCLSAAPAGNVQAVAACRNWHLLAIAALALICASCREHAQPVVDTAPLGEGLKVIGYSILGAAVLAVLGKLVKGSPPP